MKLTRIAILAAGVAAGLLRPTGPATAGTRGCSTCVHDPCNWAAGCPGNCGMSPPTCQYGVGCPATPTCSAALCPSCPNAPCGGMQSCNCSPRCRCAYGGNPGACGKYNCNPQPCSCIGALCPNRATCQCTGVTVRNCQCGNAHCPHQFACSPRPYCNAHQGPSFACTGTPCNYGGRECACGVDCSFGQRGNECGHGVQACACDPHAGCECGNYCIQPLCNGQSGPCTCGGVPCFCPSGCFSGYACGGGTGPCGCGGGNCNCAVCNQSTAKPCGDETLCYNVCHLYGCACGFVCPNNPATGCSGISCTCGGQYCSQPNLCGNVVVCSGTGGQHFGPCGGLYLVCR